MNEQTVLKILDKAGVIFAVLPKDSVYEKGVIFAVLPKDSVYEKIVEAAVNECINVVNKRYMGDNNREDFEVRRCVEDLKKHFGVEE